MSGLVDSSVTAAELAPKMPGPNRYLRPAQGWFLAFVLFLAWTAGQIDRQIMAMLAEPMRRDLHFTDEQLGVLMGFAFSVTYSISAIFVAYLGDRKGRKRVMTTGLALWSVLTAACAFAGSFPLMLLARLGVGVGESVIQPSALPMVAGAFPPEKRSFPLALCVSGSTVGLVLTPLLMGSILHATEGMTFGPYPVIGPIRGWQLAFLVGGVLGVFILPLLWLVKEPRNEHGGAQALNIRDAFRHFVRNPTLYAAVILTVPVFSIAFYGVVGWMPAYLSREFNMNSREIGLALSAAWLPAALFPLLIAGALGNWAARQGDRRANFQVLLWLLPITALFVILVPLMPTRLSCVICFGCLTVSGSTVLGYGTINVQQSVLPRYRSQATAAFAAAQSLIAFGLGPLIVGSLVTRVLPEGALGTAIIITALIACPLGYLIAYLAVRRPIDERE